jgi:TonB family protein
VVELELTVDVQGEVERVEVVGKLHPLLDAAALEAATRLRFEPAQKDGAPIAARLRFQYRFAAPAPRIVEEADLHGVVRQKGTRRLLPQVTIRVDDEPVAETDTEGRFSIRVSPGTHTLALSAAGHHPARHQERVAAGEALSVAYALEPVEAHPYETLVQGERTREEVARISLRGAELREVPGTMGDPFRVVMLLPGVGSLVSGLSYPVVRGSQPAATGYFLDGIRVPILFHLFLGPAVIHPDFLEGLDFYPGAPPTPYGRLLAGAVEGHLAHPRERDFHGSVYVDLLNAGGYLEYAIPSTGTQISVAGRYSYSALLLGLLKVGNDTRPVLSFADYQARIEQKVWTGRLRVFAFGSFDRVGLEGVGEGDPSFIQAVTFHRIDLRYQLPVGGGLFEAGVTGGWDDIGAQGEEQTAGRVGLLLSDRTFSARTSYGVPLLPVLELKVGADFQLRAAQLSGNSSAEGTGPIPSHVDAPVAQGYFTGLYAQVIWKPWPQLQLVPGLRFDTYNLEPDVHHLALEPRLAARWSLTNQLTLKLGAGLYHMAPATLITLPVQDVAGLSLGLQEAVQTDLGVEWKLLDGLDVGVDAYFNPLPRVVELDPASALLNAFGGLLPSGAGNINNPATHGRSYGVEVMVRHPLGQRWFGWLSYSFNRSERLRTFNRYDDYGDVVGTARAYLPYAFEQQHILNATVSYQVGAGWTLGATLHFHTGRPETGTFTSRTQRPGFTQTDGVDQPAWVFQDLDRAARLAPFFRADVRVSKVWTLDTFTLEAYLDFQNVAFRPEVVSYSYTTVSGPAGIALLRTPVSITLPLPILGLKAKF